MTWFRPSWMSQLAGLAIAGLLGLSWCAAAIAQDAPEKSGRQQANHAGVSTTGSTTRSINDLIAPSSSAPAGTATHEGLAGEIFGVPVSLDNYYFAKRVVYMFPRPWGAADLPVTEREPIVWESLILHYEGFRRGLTVADAEVETMVNDLLRDQKLPFTRRGDPEAYHRWAEESLQEEVDFFENQVRFLIQIRKLKDQALEQQRVTVAEEEMQQEFLNEKNHVGGEMVTFDTREEAEAFSQRVQEPHQWESMRAEGIRKVRPVSLMTLEAYMDLWGIPKDQMYAFHALPIGSIGPPMPFGKQWCVYRLLDKRTGDLKDFPAEREAYHKQVEMKKKYDAMKRWIETLKQSARLKTYVPAS